MITKHAIKTMHWSHAGARKTEGIRPAWRANLGGS